ncbi:MAG: class I SAM-dependent methyltransferase [Oscillospiraceae bacterium]
MKENKYDEAQFFEAYSHFPRSEQGLAAAGEWHELEKLLPDFKGKRVLDIGCGFGWHCRYAAEKGAKTVLGTDISQKMLAAAREKTPCGNVEYRCVAMEDLDFQPQAFDVVLSSLALHYTPDYAGLCARVWQWLAPGGAFIFSMEHPVFTAQGTQDWCHGADGERLHWPVDRYFDEGRRDAVFLGQPVVKYHRTLTTTLGALWQAGFAVKAVVEPQPPARMLAAAAEMQDEGRRPMMLLVAAEKP